MLRRFSNGFKNYSLYYRGDPPVWKDILMQLGHLIKSIIFLQLDGCLCLGEVRYLGLLRNKHVFHTLQCV